jgi:2-polyprenyl-3-methyl-5-hydroxy-6-metoxy-1,4-benzoquinol methylase
MRTEDYYGFQSVARGLNTEEDVQALVGGYGPIYDRVFLPWLPANREAVVYEAACGNGIFLRWARSRGFSRVEGSDISTREVERARSAGFAVEEANSVEVLRSRPPESIDCLVAIDFLEHLPKDQFLEFLHVAYRVLKPAGVLILRGPNGDSPFVGCNLYNDVTHFWAYTSTALRSIAQMAGFGAVDFKDDTLVSIQKRRWLKLPFMIAAQRVMKWLIRAAVHEDIQFLGASFYVCARK